MTVVEHRNGWLQLGWWHGPDSTEENGLVYIKSMVWDSPIWQQESLIERQCRGSTPKGKMLVGQHGEETADGIHWKRMGTSLLMTKKSFGCYKSWVQVKLTVAKRVVLVPRKKWVPYIWENHLGLQILETTGARWRKREKACKSVV